MSARVLVTGSREFSDVPRIVRVLQTAAALLNTLDIIVVHGAARGFDTAAAAAAVQLGFQVEAHPADWSAHGKAAGPLRNQAMIDLGADVCIAVPMHAERLPTGRKFSGSTSRGTWNCTKTASASIPTLVLWEESLFGYNPAGRELLGSEVIKILAA